MLAGDDLEKARFWNISAAQALELLKTDDKKGLTHREIESRREVFGRNEIAVQDTPSWFKILIRQFKSLLVALLSFAALVAAISGQHLDAFAIVLVLVINALIGFITEMRAISSMEALRKIGQTLTRVIREGEAKLVPSEQLVPGDLLELEAGDIVTADARLIHARNLSVSESALTGESIPVDKKSDLTLSEDTTISARQNMLMKGTFITRGNAQAVVTATGMNTELGTIADLTSKSQEEITPLEERLSTLGRKLIWLTLIIAFFILVSGVISGKDLVLMLQTAIALAVATVPEGLPIVATIALAKGLWSMAKENALINRLSAVETLGATSIIVTDKTGTLTENEMSVTQVLTPVGEYFVEGKRDAEQIHLKSEAGKSISFSEMSLGLKRLIKVLGLCNNAQYKAQGKSIGDPMEIALLSFAMKCIGSKIDLFKSYPRLTEIPFDTETKMMATQHKADEGTFVAVKGAPEAVFSSSTHFHSESEKLEAFGDDQKRQWLEYNESLAAQGLRVLAVAYKIEKGPNPKSYEDLVLLGLVGLLDPAREDVPESIRRCQEAGIRLIMATGDQVGTAKKIASSIGLIKEGEEQESSISGFELPPPHEWKGSFKDRLDRAIIFSRVSPEQKLRLIEYYQNQGYIVAMTGDGVNDAPALKKADIGVAMGVRGTQVAKEASDMVLKDDRFETIIYAIKQGRIIFSNIRKYVVYLLSCNISEVLIVGLSAILSSQLPVTPLQILFLNLVTDVFPALALGMGRGDETYLKKPPRDAQEKILEKRHWIFIIFYGSLITAIVLGVFTTSLWFLKLPSEKVVTYSFLTLGISQLFHVFNLRKKGSNIFVNDISKNPHVWGAIVLCFALLFASTYIPFMQKTLTLMPLSLKEWLAIIGISLTPWLGQLFYTQAD